MLLLRRIGQGVETVIQQPSGRFLSHLSYLQDFASSRNLGKTTSRNIAVQREDSTSPFGQSDGPQKQ